MAMIRKRVGKKKGADGKIRKTITWQAVVRRSDYPSIPSLPHQIRQLLIN